MKKILGLLGVCTIFTFAACGGIDVNLGEDANAQSTDCANGGGGSGGTGGSNGQGGDSCGCSCKAETFDGTRLKKIYLDGDDGTRAESGYFRDTKFDLNCTFRAFQNGETRCVPEHTAMNTFIDSECKVPIYLVHWKDPDCTPKLPTFVRFDLRNGTGCSANFNGFRIGSANTSQPSAVVNWYTLDTNGTCSPHGLPPNEHTLSYSVSILGEEADFVKGKLPDEF